MESTTLYNCKNCGAAFLSARYRSCCPDCGGEPQWILLCVLAVVFGLLLGLKALGHAQGDCVTIDCRDGHKWRFVCGSPCEESTIQRELTKCPLAKKDKEGFIGWAAIRDVSGGTIQPMTDVEKRAAVEALGAEESR